jgi:hypothetical protein
MLAPKLSAIHRSSLRDGGIDVGDGGASSTSVGFGDDCVAGEMIANMAHSD